jgi:hypothetical protein
MSELSKLALPLRIVVLENHINICGTPGGIVMQMKFRLHGRFQNKVADHATAKAIVDAVNEHEKLKSRLHEIELAVEGYIDGAPDRDASANMANQIMQIIEGKN